MEGFAFSSHTKLSAVGLLNARQIQLRDFQSTSTAF